jgi:hypothetical protein
MKNPVTDCSTSRRRLLFAGFAALIAGIFGSRKAAAAATQSLGQPMTTHMRQGEPPFQPLDTMLLFERSDENNSQAITHEVLSLIQQEKGKNSYPWTLYTSLDTHHEVGDACGICSRVHKHGPGWATGVHSEVFCHHRGTGIGVNIEMSTDYAGGEESQVIGMNIQAVGGAKPMKHGIQIHDGGNHFETGIHLNGKGTTGVDLHGNYNVGINLRNNNVRLNEGACVELDGKGQIKVRYKNNRIEFLNGDKCFGHLDVNGEDHAL